MCPEFIKSKYSFCLFVLTLWWCGKQLLYWTQLMQSNTEQRENFKKKIIEKVSATNKHLDRFQHEKFLPWPLRRVVDRMTAGSAWVSNPLLVSIHPRRQWVGADWPLDPHSVNEQTPPFLSTKHFVPLVCCLPFLEASDWETVLTNQVMMMM